MIALAGAATLLAAPVSAAAETEVVQGERIRIVSTIDEEAATELAPGAAADWFVDVSVLPGEPGEIDISLAEAGPLALDVAVYRCEVHWEANECPTGEARIRAPGGLESGEAALMTMPHTDAAHLRLVVTAPEDVAPEKQGQLRLIAAGVGDEQEAGSPPSPLEPTGTSLPWVIGCAAAGMLIAGAAITATRRRARRVELGRGDGL